MFNSKVKIRTSVVKFVARVTSVSKFEASLFIDLMKQADQRAGLQRLRDKMIEAGLNTFALLDFF